MKTKTNTAKKPPFRGQGKILLQLNGDGCALRLRKFEKGDYVLSIIEDCDGTGKNVATFRLTERRALILADALCGTKSITVEDTAQ